MHHKGSLEDTFWQDGVQLRRKFYAGTWHATKAACSTRKVLRRHFAKWDGVHSRRPAACPKSSMQHKES
eukprot:scaffold210228_cov22-Tisochrysis_lutea.AAC.1